MSNDPKPKCPQCGAALPSDAPAGLCPGCLMRLNLATETAFAAAPADAQPPLPPEQIAPHFPQLEILECLGRGGMGVVYKARQKTLNRFVALKLLAPERVGDPAFAGRFAREAQALAALNHPNIVTIHDFGQAGGFYFLLMEFVDGVNLRQLLRARKFKPEEALIIVPPLCDALQFAHEHGIVHRDIKPENILLDKAGRVKVADFGIAKMLGPVAGSGEAGAPAGTGPGATQNVVGTRGYCAPEQESAPQRVDSRADIYSLGVVFYEMLTGELPGKPIELPSRKVQIDVRLDEVVLRALEKKPELRFQQASVFKTQVETIVMDSSQAKTSAPAAGASGAAPPPYWYGYEYKSKRTLFGLPWLHVANGIDPVTGSIKRARGIVAVGGIATGVFAFGGRAYGIFAFGGIAVGGIAMGGLAAGAVAFGGGALALLLAVGGMAVAPVATGGMAAGYSVMAGLGYGVRVWDSRQHGAISLQSIHAHLIEAQRNTLLVSGLALAFIVLVQGWARRKVLGAPLGQVDGNRRRWPMIVLATVATIFLLGWVFFHLSPATKQQLQLADDPSQLTGLPTAEVLRAGLGEKNSAWPWIELQHRANAGSLSSTDAVMIVDGLTDWLRRDHPQGYDDPLPWLDNMLRDLPRQLVPETSSVAFTRALTLTPVIEPLSRVAETDRNLPFSCKLRSAWHQPFFELEVLKDPHDFTVDGQPVLVHDTFGRPWNFPEYSGELKLPPLVPGTHTFRMAVVSGIVSESEMTIFEENSSLSLSIKDWPPTKERWTNVLEQRFEIYGTNTSPVTLSDDAMLNPVTAGAVAIKRVVVRPHGRRLQAIVEFTIAPVTNVPVSMDVQMKLGPDIFSCGPVIGLQPASRLTANHDTATAQIGSLDADIDEADIILSPDVQALATESTVTRIWGRNIEFAHVPVERWDLQKTN